MSPNRLAACHGPLGLNAGSTEARPGRFAMSDDESREWTFHLNIAGLTLLLFAAGYIGKHFALLVPLPGASRVLAHYFGELVLTGVAVGLALWRAFGASRPHRPRVAWL